MIGFSSYLVLFLGELMDIYFAPVFFFFLQYMFGSLLVSSLGCLEELLPFTDILECVGSCACTQSADKDKA